MSDSQFDCDTATGQELAGAVADYIEEHGWTRGSLCNSEGEVCLVGGIAGVCSGDPKAGYALLQGYRGFSTQQGFNNIQPGSTPKAVVELAEALRPKLHIEPIRHLYNRTIVSDGALTTYNDHVASGKDELLGVLRQVQQGGAVGA